MLHLTICCTHLSIKSCLRYYLNYMTSFGSMYSFGYQCHTFSAFWLWSSVVSVLISVTTNITPIWSLSCHFNFYWERAYLGPSPVSFYPWLCFAHLLEFREPFGVTQSLRTEKKNTYYDPCLPSAHANKKIIWSNNSTTLSNHVYTITPYQLSIAAFTS